MSELIQEQQPLPREGESYAASHLELAHVNEALHDIWLRAVSIVWNDAVNSKPWGKMKMENGFKLVNRIKLSHHFLLLLKHF